MNKNKEILNLVDGRKLDKTQFLAVTTKRKNVLVLAGAGCGKTLTIVARVRYLINYLKIEASEILCLSFTNDAVNKLKEDLNINGVDVMTFHKLSLKIIGRKKEVLTENMLRPIIENTFCNDALFGVFGLNKEEMYGVVESFISVFKARNYNLDDFSKFISRADAGDKALLKEIMKCYVCYEAYLNKENLVDFNDMINLAIKALDDHYSSSYKHVIIDEYQDVSYTKYLLIKMLQKKTNASVFAVGDDFQSIYRFSGSEVKLITNFRYYFSFAKVYKLKNTYRNSKQLVNVAGRFIMRNKRQVRKCLRSDISIDNPVNVIWYDDLLSSMLKIIKTDKLDNIFVLGRNNDDVKSVVLNNVNYQKMTVHRSKGLQADYVFVVGLTDFKNGFPNKFTDHKILKYVNDNKEYYPYEEERRLFYVALTRCIKKVYLFVPRKNPSLFVKELLKQYKNVVIREK